jgi:hypothetical protein
MERHDCEPNAFRVSFPGPYTQHDVVVDGWRVPFLQAELVGEDRVQLVLDQRFAMELDSAEAEKLIPFLADAVAVALGFGSHPRADTEPPLERLPYPRPIRVSALVGPAD